jgi:hypothetical protein
MVASSGTQMELIVHYSHPLASQHFIGALPDFFRGSLYKGHCYIRKQFNVTFMNRLKINAYEVGK